MNTSWTAAAKQHMIERQLKPCGITNSSVLQALWETPREHFAPPEWASVAYADQALPLPHQQHMLSPLDAAHLLQAARLEPTDSVLEVGTGSGYLTALLASLSFQTHSVEQHPELSAQAREALPAQEHPHVHFWVGNGLLGWNKQAPYDAIVLTGSVPHLPEALLHQLAPGGRLVACVGLPRQPGTLRVVRCLRPGHYEEHTLHDMQLEPLTDPEPPSFVF